MKTENLPIEGEKEKAAGKTEKQAEHGKQKDSDISDREKENKEMKMKEKCVFEEKGDGKKKIASELWRGYAYFYSIN